MRILQRLTRCGTYRLMLVCAAKTVPRVCIGTLGVEGGRGRNRVNALCTEPRTTSWGWVCTPVTIACENRRPKKAWARL